MKRSIVIMVLLGGALGFRTVQAMDIASVSNATDVATYLAQFPYCDTNISASTEIKVSRLWGAVLDLLQSDLVVSDTNALMAVADHIAIGKPLPMQNRDADIRAAIRHDRFVEFGDSNYVIRSGVIRRGPTAYACQLRYSCREHYNDKRAQIRKSIFRYLKEDFSRPRWKIYSEDTRKSLLREFYRRAEATEIEVLDSQHWNW